MALRVRKLLGRNELKELLELLRDLFVQIEEVRESHAMGQFIKRLQVPSIFSESLAAYLLNSGFLGNKVDVTSSLKGGDLLVVWTDGTTARLEVKATTASAFQQLGKKDVACDVLIWIHFDDFFWNLSRKEIHVFFLLDPGTIFKEPKKIRLGKFLEMAGNHVKKITVDLTELLEG